MKTFEQLMSTHTDWSLNIYKDGTKFTSLIHLRKEVGELEQAIISDESKANIGFELADCFLLLFDAAARCGFDGMELKSYIEAKININKERKWQKQDDGTYRHV